MIDQSDLDARPVNGLAGIGALFALGLTLVALRHGGIGASAAFRRSDWLRIAVAALLVVAALPWIWAEVGYYVNDAPVIGDPFIAEQVKRPSGANRLFTPFTWATTTASTASCSLSAPCSSLGFPAVCHGAARGPRSGSTWRSSSRMAWQTRSRTAGTSSWSNGGTSDSKLPSVIRPDLSAAWLGILVGAVAIYAVVFGVGRVKRPEGGIR